MTGSTLGFRTRTIPGGITPTELPSSPQSGMIAIHDLTPGEHYTVETWDTYTTTQQIISQENLTVQADGSLQININNLQDDLAFKFRPEMTPGIWLPLIV